MSPKAKKTAKGTGATGVTAAAATPAAMTAAAQLRRLLLILPSLADDRAHPIAELAARLDVSERVIANDLAAMVTRAGDEPGGFTEGVSLLLGADTVQFQTPNGHFRRPMALTRMELEALELGLAMREQEAPPDERGPVRKARERLQRVLVTMPRDHEVATTPMRGDLGPDDDRRRSIRRQLQQCIKGRRVATITYRAATKAEPDTRRVRPVVLVWSRGLWYLVAWCERSDGLRVFRSDRIVSAQCEAERFDTLDGFSIDDVMRDGRVLVGEPGTPMRVRYSARIARWIAEREGTPIAEDGSTEQELEALQEDWAVGHVLRYGPDAELVTPPELRVAVIARLTRLLE